MAKFIATDGKVVDLVPANGTSFTLEELQGAVGGMIEMVRTEVPGHVMFINEEGKLMELPPNEKATALMDRTLYAPWDRIVGPVLLVSMTEAGEEEA